MSQEMEPHVNLNQEHENEAFALLQSNIPDTLHRLRLSALKDGHGHRSCPSQMFIFKTLAALHSAAGSVTSRFGEGLSPYTIQRSGILDANRGTEDGRTEDMTLEYDSVTAEESWDEFLGRVHNVGSGWQVEL